MTENAPQTIEVTIDAEGIAVLTLDRPDRMNAFTIRMGREIVTALDRLDADDAVRVVVLTGRGRAFCAGADLDPGGKTFDTSTDPRKASERPPFRDPGGVVSLRIHRMAKPVIAAINGPAVGIGLTMTLATDIRIAAEGAKMGFVFAGRGIAADGASSWFLPRLVGLQQALEWCLTARVFRSEEALAAGLVLQLKPADEVLPAALDLARSIAHQAAPVSAALTRQLLVQMAGATTPQEAHERESQVLDYLGGAADAREGVKAFLDRRDPEWKLSVPADLPPWYSWDDARR